MGNALHKTRLYSVTAVLLGTSFISAAAPVAEKVETAKTDPNTRTYRLPDYTSHVRLACVKADFRASVKDGSDQSANSNREIGKFPCLTLHNPVGISLSELRKALALDSRKAGKVSADLASLLKAQEKNITNPATFETLKAIQQNLANAKTPEVMDQVVTDLWSIILQLEEDALSKAEKVLRDAEKNLRDALENRVDSDQLKKAMEDARKAMEDALKEMIDKAAQENDPQVKRELEEMKKAIEDMKKLLEAMQKPDPRLADQLDKDMKQLQDMMRDQNKSSQQSGQQSAQQKRQSMKQKLQQQMAQMQQQQEMQKMMNELDRMIQEQEKLMNETAKETGQHAQDMGKVLDMLEKFAKRLDHQADNQLTKRQARMNEISEEYPSLRLPNYPTETIPLAPEHPDEKYTAAKAERDVLIEKKGVLNILKDPIKKIKDRIQELRTAGRSISEREAKEHMMTLADIKKKLDAEEEKKKQQKKEKDGQKQDGQQGGQQQQDQDDGEEDLAEQIKQMMEQRSQSQSGKNMQQMKQRQKDLQKKLQDLKDKAKQKGMPSDDLDEADKQMGEASDDLEGDDPGNAVSSQNDAMEAMRKQQQQMQMSGKPKPGENGDDKETRTKPDIGKDPLGRDAEAPEAKIDPYAAVNRDRQTEDKIREELAQPGLTEAHRKYLNDLLRNKSSGQQVQQKPSP